MKEGTLKVRVEEEESYDLFILEGEIDAYQIKEVKKAVDKYYSFDKHLIFDFTKVPFMDSSGLAYLLELKKTMGENKTIIYIVYSDKKILKIFEITGFLEIFDFVKSRAEARKKILLNK